MMQNRMETVVPMKVHVSSVALVVLLEVPSANKKNSDESAVLCNSPTGRRETQLFELKILHTQRHIAAMFFSGSLILCIYELVLFFRQIHLCNRK